jgi:hypothetical protein
MLTDYQISQAQVKPQVTPRIKKIPPRAEFLLRHINGVMLQTTMNTLSEELPAMRPPIVSTAFAIVNETTLLDVQDYTADVQFQTRQ